MNPAPLLAASILVIEADPLQGAFVQQHLEGCGFQVTWCRDGGQALAVARATEFDLVLLEVLAPGIDGLATLGRLREWSATPVILMSTLSSEADRIDGYRSGADDYLPKPFSFAELRVRIEALLRRVALERGKALPVATSSDATLLFDGVRADVCHQAQWAGFTPSEFRLLDTLQRSPEAVLSKAFLYQHVLQRGYAQHDRSLDMHISQIRRKLKAIGYQARRVRTVWGLGYSLTAQASEA